MAVGIVSRIFRALRLADPDTPYRRAVLALGRHAAVALCAWRPGKLCWPHDHGGARGLVIVLSGTCVERKYLPTCAGLTLVETVRVVAPALTWIEAADVHDVVFPEGGLSLHLYWPCPGSFVVYRPDGVRLRVARGLAFRPSLHDILREGEDIAHEPTRPWRQPG